MCDICVINSVKERMLSRRDMFKGVAAVGAAAAVVTTAAAPSAMADGHGKVHDMTHELHQKFPTYFGVDGFFMEQKFNYAEHKFNLFELKLNEHTGTHMDAPLHFSADGQSVAEVPVSNLVVPLCVVDIKAKAAENADAQVTPDDLKAWTSANGPIPDNACVAMNSGWDKHVATDKFRNADGEKKCISPASTSKRPRCSWKRPRPLAWPWTRSRWTMAHQLTLPATTPGCPPTAGVWRTWPILMRYPPRARRLWLAPRRTVAAAAVHPVYLRWFR